MKDNLDVGIDFILEYNSTPNTLLVFFVDVSPLAQNQSWIAATSKAICTSYMPSDAKFVKVVPSVEQSSGLDVIEMYSSASLANRLPASYFTDNHQNQVKPGPIYLEYQYQNLSDSSHIQTCLVGTSQIDN